MQKTISVTEQQDDWIRHQVAAGDYADDSAYIRDLIRRDQERNVKIAAMQALIDEAEESGVSSRSVHEIFDEALARHTAR